MKILLVNKFHYRKGGSETYYFELAQGLRNLGHEVVFFSMQDSQNAPCEQEEFFVSPSDYNGKLSVLQKVKAATSLIYSSEAKRKFELLLQKEKPDVIHLNLTHRQITFSILDAPSAKNIPVVFTSHDYIMVCPNYTMLNGSGAICEECLAGSFAPCFANCCVKGSRAKSLLAKLEADYLRKNHVYNRLDAIVAPSNFMRDKLIQGGLPESKVIALQNFMPQSSTLDREKENAHPYNVSTPYFLFFGRLSKEKGVELLIRAFLNISDKLPRSLSLIVAGNGPERSKLEQLVKEHNSADKIIFTGQLRPAEMAEYVSGAHFCITPSVWYENMPYSILESFAAGVPVIGSNLGGIPELVIEEETGFLFDHNNVEDLENALIKAASCSSEDRQFMGTNCRMYIQEHCNQETYLNQLVALYEQLLGKDAHE